ncbi:hypothetical protein [Bacillus sp. FJAT-50079]|uniref:hypothetical protein n=1 Tax=Bacillus sp. FJAT-50079 TaxID=2833577 RepID=UPI001BC9468F|nr:hypothetical protein [Bacillus sp. FJAT-50079]MBS4208015.1 hypothetical protein [Bacillus sp. FJAT-50079]
MSKERGGINLIEWILDHKWLFFIMGEVLFWGSIIGFISLRYLFRLESLSKYFILIWIFSDLWLFTIGVLDYRRTGEFATFQIIIIIFLLYALTFGRSDMKKLDRWMKRTIKKWKGEPLDETDITEKLYGMAYALKQGKEFALHLLLYVGVIIIFSFFYKIRAINEITNGNGTGDMIENVIKNGWFDHPFIGKVTGVWTLVLVIDALITVSYFLFPKKK